MEIKIQKIKPNNTSSNIKKYTKFHYEHKNNSNISNTNNAIYINNKN